MRVYVADDPAGAAEVATRWMTRHIVNAIRATGSAHIAFSGGTTPALMLRDLSQVELAWTRVVAYQVDERVAPDGDPARNATLFELLRTHNRRLMAVTAKDLRAAARRYAAHLPDRLDAVHLGIGDDGHTASWPPGDPVVDSTSPVAISGAYRGHVRMTLTPVVVNAAKSRMVLATGADKADAIRRWFLHDATVPIERLRRAATTVILDAAAAGGLRRSERPEAVSH